MCPVIFMGGLQQPESRRSPITSHVNRSNPPAGWYPDPEGGSQVRWWDGENWTQSSAPAPIGGDSKTRPVVSSQNPDQKMLVTDATNTGQYSPVSSPGTRAGSSKQIQLPFLAAIEKVFANYASFSGRAQRSEYWYWQLWNISVLATTGLVTSFLYSLTGINFVTAIFVAWVGLIVPTVAVTVRRLHDVGFPGTLLAIVFPILFVGIAAREIDSTGISIYLVGACYTAWWIWLLVTLLRESDKQNQYGIRPNGRAAFPKAFTSPKGKARATPRYQIFILSILTALAIEMLARSVASL